MVLGLRVQGAICFACILLAILAGLSIKNLIVIVATLLFLLFIVHVWIPFLVSYMTQIGKAQIKAMLPLWEEDTRTIEEYLRYEKHLFPKMEQAICFTLLIGVILLLFHPPVNTLLILINLFIIVSLFCFWGYHIYIFLDREYSNSRRNSERIPEVRRFIASQSFSILWLTTILTIGLIPMRVFLDFLLSFANPPDGTFMHDVFTPLVSGVLRSISLTLLFPVIVASAVFTLLPLHLIMGMRVLKYYFLFLVALVLILALPVSLETKVIGVVGYLTALNYVTMPRSTPIGTRAKVAILSLCGIVAGLVLSLVHMRVGFESLSFLGVVLALSSAVLLDLILC